MSIPERGRKGLLLGLWLLLPVAVLLGCTLVDLAELPATSLQELVRRAAPPTLTDRHGVPLNRTYQTRFNGQDLVALHDAPPLLVDALVQAEDARFYRHRGVDWLARIHALWQNLRAGRVVRGASTITEQVVRILHPRPRTYWSRWLEGWDALRLEGRFTKTDILEFYLNQVPYASSRRGVIQAARFWFGRSLATLNTKELLALAVMVRSPSLLTPDKEPQGLAHRVAGLAELLHRQGMLAPDQMAAAHQEGWSRARTDLAVQAPHFVAFAQDRIAGQGGGGPVRTSLDGGLQHKTQQFLERRLVDLAGSGLRNGAVLVVDHTTSEVLVWAVAGELTAAIPESGFDAVRIPRQPGSTLKPMVYALALDTGWSPATLIRDEPVPEAVERGLHVYRNFSETYHELVPLADALGNSLNTPAIRTLEFVGPQRFLDTLRRLGVASLHAGLAVYGNGVVLGNAEIPLLELVQAYGGLARGGRPMRVAVLAGGKDDRDQPFTPVVTERSARTIGMILSEADCRRFEFGRDSILDFPVRTAVKTGTSTKGNDLWTMAYDGRFVVGSWMGNLDRSAPILAMTGASGPALLVRTVFAELRRHYGLHPLPTVPLARPEGQGTPVPTGPPRMVVPTPDMEVVLEARIPRAAQAIPFTLAGVRPDDEVRWFVDGTACPAAHQGKMLWPVVQGSHRVVAEIHRAGGEVIRLPERRLVVK